MTDDYLTRTAKCTRCWNNDDLPGIGRRIADHARHKLEATDRTWVHLPGFREAVTEAAVMFLETVIQHERQHGSEHRGGLTDRGIPPQDEEGGGS